MYSDIDEGSAMINVVRALITQHDDFGAVVLELAVSYAKYQAVYLLAYDTEALRPSTYHMTNQVNMAPRAFQVTTQRTVDLKEHFIGDNS